MTRHEEGTALDQIRQKISSAFRMYRILSRLVRQEFDVKILGPILVGGLGLAAQVFSIALIFYYAKLLTSEGKFVALGYSFDPRHSLSLLAVFCLAGLIALVVWAYSTYYYNFKAAAYSAQLEAAVLRKTLETVSSHSPLSVPLIEDSTPENSVLHIALGDSRCIGRSLQAALQAAVPSVTVVGGTLVLFYIRWEVTLFLIPIGLGYFYFLYRVNLRGVHSSRDFEKQKAGVRALLWNFVNSIRSHDRPVDTRPFWSSAVESRTISSYLDGYQNLILLPTRTALVNDVFLSFGLVGILFVFSYLTIWEQSNWTAVGSYLVSLRYTVNSLKQVTARMAIINRFTPQLDRFSRFSNYNQNLNSSHSPKSPEVMAIFSDLQISRFVTGTVVSQLCHFLTIPGSGTVYLHPKGLDLGHQDLTNFSLKFQWIFLPYDLWLSWPEDVQEKFAKAPRANILLYGAPISTKIPVQRAFVFIKQKVLWIGDPKTLPKEFVARLSSQRPTHEEFADLSDVSSFD